MMKSMLTKEKKIKKPPKSAAKRGLGGKQSYAHAGQWSNRAEYANWEKVLLHAHVLCLSYLHKIKPISGKNLSQQKLRLT
ncbi:hypothetical protein [Bacillus massilinigeriensis]|uniref:hypothetical protein n=1 Tax=Bacillus mediterraneensis TaxID=1805474 RepID=UPI0008F9419A|nr:hypothetical protein [Bacillus mediterraneensis]